MIPVNLILDEMSSRERVKWRREYGEEKIERRREDVYCVLWDKSKHLYLFNVKNLM